MKTKPVSEVYLLSSHGTNTFCFIQMGYDFGVPLPGGFHGLQNPDFTPSMLYNADCDGSEGSIWDCSMNTNNGTNTECCSDCYDKSVAVYCSRFC